MCGPFLYLFTVVHIALRIQALFNFNLFCYNQKTISGEQGEAKERRQGSLRPGPQNISLGSVFWPHLAIFRAYPWLRDQESLQEVLGGSYCMLGIEPWSARHTCCTVTLALMGHLYSMFLLSSWRLFLGTRTRQWIPMNLTQWFPREPIWEHGRNCLCCPTFLECDSSQVVFTHFFQSHSCLPSLSIHGDRVVGVERKGCINDTLKIARICKHTKRNVQ